MNISPDTKISELIKANPACIEAIVSINKHFEKLRNPILRKILASRVTIADAAKIGGCTVNDFFKKLQPLGFKVADDNTTNIQPTLNERPSFMMEINSNNTFTLDVRHDLASGKDPFQKIMNTLSTMPHNNFLLIINTFEPIPLINILKKKGFEFYTEKIQKDLFHTYFAPPNLPNRMPPIAIAVAQGEENLKTASLYQGNKIDSSPLLGRPGGGQDFREIVNKFKGNIQTIDVRNMEMPLPMVTILKELETLPEGKALFVHHKKIPQFLLPELEERNFYWRINEAGEGDVKLLIFR